MPDGRRASGTRAHAMETRSIVVSSHVTHHPSPSYSLPGSEIFHPTGKIVGLPSLRPPVFPVLGAVDMAFSASVLSQPPSIARSF